VSWAKWGNEYIVLMMVYYLCGLEKEEKKKHEITEMDLKLGT
jgi:hypothetical protein